MVLNEHCTNNCYAVNCCLGLHYIKSRRWIISVLGPWGPPFYLALTIEEVVLNEMCTSDCYAYWLLLRITLHQISMRKLSDSVEIFTIFHSILLYISLSLSLYLSISLSLYPSLCLSVSLCLAFSPFFVSPFCFSVSHHLNLPIYLYLCFLFLCMPGRLRLFIFIYVSFSV